MATVVGGVGTSGPAGSAFSFSFAKKAEPKRVVEALAQKKDDGRVSITGVEGGAVTVDGKVEEAKKLTIPCKNRLDERGPKSGSAAIAKASEAARAASDRGGGAEGGEQEEKGGLLAPKMSAEDAEALQELRKEVSAGGDLGAEGKIQVAPILMREGSKKVREGSAPDASKDMFEKVPIEAFGEALLRGMGFDPSKHRTKPVFHDKPRDNLLGLGAKPLLPSERVAAKGKAKAKADAVALGAGPPTVAGPSPRAAVPSPSASSPALDEDEDEAAGADEASPSAKRRRQDRPAAESAAFATAASSQGGSSGSGGRAGSVPAAADMWASRGLVVRVRRRRDGEPRLKEFRGCEAVVLEAEPSSGFCRIKARLKEQSHMLQKVPIADLEPTLGPDCRRVRILQGASRGAEANIIRLSSRKDAAIVLVNATEQRLALADVCEFIAPKR